MSDTKDKDTVRIVTFTGDLGSGKSVISQKIAALLNAQRFSAGDIQREAAKRSRQSTFDLNNDALANAWLDQQIDGQIQSLGQSQENTVVDARMGWHFIPHSFRVKFLTKPSVSAHRIMGDSTRDTEKYTDVTQAEQAIISRQEAEWNRFRKKYGADFSDSDNFDLIVDTSFASLETIYDIVAECMDRFYKGEVYNKYWVSPLQLIPTENIVSKAETLCENWAPCMAQNGYADDFPVVVVDVQGSQYLFDGHKRTFGAASTDIGLIPAVVHSEDEEYISGASYGEEIRNAYNLRHIGDWQEGINYCRKQMGNEPIVDFSLMHRHSLQGNQVGVFSNSPSPPSSSSP